jgi:glycerophosphoryl diester phosphodiesterase
MSVPAPPPLPPVVGHRGAKGHAPENTLAGMRKAAELGARWVEFDVKLTADGELVVMHDDRVNRTTDGKGAIAAMTFAEIRELDAGRWFSPDFSGEQVPTLDEVMQFLAFRGMGANVEVKPCPGREAETGAAIARSLGARWLGGPAPVLISSFSEVSLAAALQAAPEVPRGYLAAKFPKDWLERTRGLGCATFHMADRQFTETRVRSVRDAGVRPVVYTVNDARRAKDLLEWGMEAVITDYPDRILAVVP